MYSAAVVLHIVNRCTLLALIGIEMCLEFDSNSLVVHSTDWTYLKSLTLVYKSSN